VHGPCDEAGTTEVVTVGGAMVDRYYALSNLPAPDGGAYVRDERTGFGGVAANVASALTRLGRSTGIVTRLGDDDDGDAALADLRDRGIDIERVRRGSERSTYSMVLRSGGERMVVTGGRSCAALRPRAGDREYLSRADAVAATAYAPDAVTGAVLAAREAGAIDRLSFDLSGPLAELRDRGTEPQTVDRAVAACDLLVVGEVALSAYLDHHGATDPVTLLRDRGVGRAALTRGEDGATLVTPEETVDVDAVDVATVDSTGAGDAFHAGLVDAWLLDGRPAAAAGRFAATVAALNCTGEGARGGLPTRAAVEEALASR
jgi:ribokinase/sulfofructose kinase